MAAGMKVEIQQKRHKVERVKIKIKTKNKKGRRLIKVRESWEKKENTLQHA
jgi:hypothetical protein